MNNIIPFVRKSSTTKQDSLDKLVAHYKAFMSKPLENPISPRKSSWAWGDLSWAVLGRFIKYEHSKSLGSTTKTVPLHMTLPERTKEEIQAMVLHFIILNQNKSETLFGTFLRAILIIEMALRQRSHDGIANFSDLKASDLEYGISLSQEINNTDRPPDIALAKNMLIDLGIVSSGAVKNWVNSALNKHKRSYNSTARSLETKNLNKLPNMKAVLASAEYFANQPWLTKGEDAAKLDIDQRNIIVSSILAIISLVPCRHQELIKNLPVNCLVRRPESSVGEVLSIQWYSDKTDMGHDKYVPYTASGVFEEVIEEAVSRLKYITNDARSLLRIWDQECPEYIEAEFLKAKADKRLPKNWPWADQKTKLRYSDAMFVCFRHQMHPVNHTIKNLIEIIEIHNFRDWLRTKASKNNWTGEPSIAYGFFDRIGHSDLELTLEDYNSHTYRHMVNTAARLGGMSEFDVNMWSHRRQQGEVYNHTTGEQRRNLITHGDYKSKELTPEERLNHINHRLPMTRKNLGMRFEIVGNNFGGFTFNHPLGTCTHNYVEGPCLRDMDCVMCPENMHCKGDKRTLKNLKEELNESNKFLELAITDNDQLGQNKYAPRSEVLIALVDVLGDDSPLADGDLVILSPDQTPAAGVLERARLTAEQIKKNQTKIEQRHEDTKIELGVTRSLPDKDNQSPNNAAIENTLFDIDELLLDFDDEAL